MSQPCLKNPTQHYTMSIQHMYQGACEDRLESEVASLCSSYKSVTNDTMPLSLRRDKERGEEEAL